MAQVYSEFTKNVMKVNEDSQDVRIEFLYKRFNELDKDLEDTQNEPYLDQEGMYLFFMFIHSLITLDL